MLPNFFCIGAQKSGTTTLWHLLDGHPQVCMARPRETRHFSEAVRFADGLGAYELHHFAHWRGEPLVGEKCPEYLYQAEVPARLHASLGGALKFLVCLRDPAQRAYAQYRHNVFQLREARTFEQALADEAAEAASGRRVPPPFGYIGRGLYAEQLERYVVLFGREACHLIAFEALATAQAAMAAQVFAFLGIDPTRRPAAPVHAGHAPLETLRLDLDGGSVRLRRDAPAEPGWRRAARALLQPRRARPDDVLVRRPSAALLAIVARVEAARTLPAALAPDVATAINQAHFADDLARLAALVDWPVAPWLGGLSPP